MRYQSLFGKSSKTEGSNLECRSHQLLVQAGYIRESVAGRYYFLPLGLIVINKIIDLIRREMNRAGALEVSVPVLHPLELWQETNRDNQAGFELMQVKDRRGAKFALGGTAEEMFVDLVRKFNLSYKDLPFNLYQFGLKFRDELRAKGGLLRVREFVMKDAYSFSTEEQFEAQYQLMKETYTGIFSQLGLATEVVLADGGYIGGDYCHEFVVESGVGESTYFVTDKGYLVHEDLAEFDKTIPHGKEELQPLEKVAAKRGPTMADSFRFHRDQPAWKHIKNVVYINESREIVLACLRGDLEVNEKKLMKCLGCHHLQPLTDQQIKDLLASRAGFLSAVGLASQKPDHPLKIVMDDSLAGLQNLISGANQLNQDYVNINPQRDFKADITTDIALAKAGYTGLDGGQLAAKQGIEVGNIFQLGYHYTDKMARAQFVDQSGKLAKYYMGCYGIGVGRTMAAIVEMHNDDKGIIWPEIVAPFQVYLANLGQDGPVVEFSDRVYQHLIDQGVAVLYDDRDNVSHGEKLANSDLLGIPIRLIVSPKTAAESQIEIKRRQRTTSWLTTIDDLMFQIQQ